MTQFLSILTFFICKFNPQKINFHFLWVKLANKEAKIDRNWPRKIVHGYKIFVYSVVDRGGFGVVPYFAEPVAFVPSELF